jgi:asparagine synthase (glutamine-hydrolysing)
MRAVRLARAVPAGASVARAGLRRLAGPGRWAKVADALGRPASLASAYVTCRGLFSPGEARDLLRPDVWEAGCRALDPVREIGEHADSPDGAGTFAWVSRAELQTYTHHQLLRDTDVMSMAHSLEVRVPLLDHRLVETVLRLPESLKRNGGRPKSLLLRAVGDLLPAAVLAPRAKQGFVFPFDAWLRGPLRRTCREWQAGLSDLLREDAVARVQRAYEAGRLHWSRPWALAALQGWRMAAGARTP